MNDLMSDLKPTVEQRQIGKEKCWCGRCNDWWLTGIGKFVQGSGFSEEEADEIITRFNATRTAELTEKLVESTSLDGVWEQARENHERYSATGDPESDLRFLTLGLVGEAGELANFVKKRWRDGDLHEDDCRKEVADVLAYTMMVAQRLDMTPADLIATVAKKQAVFVAKMETRNLKDSR